MQNKANFFQSFCYSSILLFALFLCSEGRAQVNLVPNPSFEDTSSCPNQLNQLIKATSWFSVFQSPDYYNRCADLLTNVSIPHNLLGHQNPSSGNAYAGFWGKNANNYREYLGAHLNSIMQIGTKYYVNFKVNLAANPTFSQYCGINNIGILFSKNQIINWPSGQHNNFAQIYTNSIIQDTSNWISIHGSFIADSSYSFITIGNLFSDSLTDTIQISGSICEAYYFLDDICISADSSYCSNYIFTEIDNMSESRRFSVFPNPANDFINILSNDISRPYCVKICNINGEILFYKNNITETKEQIPITLFDSNFLLIKITTQDNIFNYKILLII